MPNEMKQADDHAADADCDVDPETDCCRACGVYHGDPCARCGGRGFHVGDCDGAPRGWRRMRTSMLFALALLVAACGDNEQPAQDDAALPSATVPTGHAHEWEHAQTADGGPDAE